MINHGFQLLRQNWIMILIVILATWLRTTELDTHAIFFGDAGRDLLVAAQSVQDKKLPLLGIPSSVPRFHQGPLTIWLEMLIFVLVGFTLYPFSVVFALISIAAVIGIYELLTVYGHQRQGQMAALLLAASPLAVAHGRMVYHINPIPLAMILYLWSVVRLAENRPRAVFWSVLAWCFLFQFELAVLPVIILIPYFILRQRQAVTRNVIIEAVAAFVIGLAPQLIYDLTHGFSQLGGFGIWVGYRMLSAISVVGEHALGPSSLAQTVQQFKLYGLRILSHDQPVIGVLFGVILCLSAGLSWAAWKQAKLSTLMEVSWLAFIVLVVGFAVHSSPSEAYFPVFLILVPILISYPLARFSARLLPLVWSGLVVWAVIMVFSISRNGWFVGQTTGFAYGPALSEQREIIMAARQLSHDSFTLTTLQAGGQFVSHFDNLRWLLREAGLTENPDGLLIFIEPKNSELDGYPNVTKVESTTIDLYVYE